MNCFKEYLAYLRDNPEGYWFKRKLYGYGWTPATKEGWLILGIYLIFVLGLVLIVSPELAEENIMSHILIPVAVATLLLIIISWRKGEPLKWQWGSQKKQK